MKNYWYITCFKDELKNGQHQAYTILGLEILVFKTQLGHVAAVENRCCHRNIHLSLGYVESETMICAYHGWQYNVEGKCQHIPSLGQEKSIPQTACIKSYQLILKHNIYWIYLGGDDADLSKIPSIPEMDMYPFVYNRHEFPADLKLLAESLIDPYHINHVHKNSINTFMGNLGPEIKDFILQTDEDKLAGSYLRENKGSFFEKFYFGFDPFIKTEYGFYFPNVSYLFIKFKQRTLFIYEHFYATDENKIMMIQITLWKNIFSISDIFAKWFMLKKSNKIVEEDIAFLASKKSLKNPLKDVFIKSDKISLAFDKLWEAKLNSNVKN